MNDKAKILFVDDEKRVLNSMRGLFRREYELFLTTDGEAALKIVNENSIDVIVADQRMPGMTGTEVLGSVKLLSPRTVRILLTGYADPEAVEGSINVGQVFRFLNKPCPTKLLRETLVQAIALARTNQAEPASAPSATTAAAATSPFAPPPADPLPTDDAMASTITDERDHAMVTDAVEQPPEAAAPNTSSTDVDEALEAAESTAQSAPLTAETEQSPFAVDLIHPEVTTAALPDAAPEDTSVQRLLARTPEDAGGAFVDELDEPLQPVDDSPETQDTTVVDEDASFPEQDFANVASEPATPPGPPGVRPPEIRVAAVNDMPITPEPAPLPSDPDESGSHWQSVTEVVMSGDRSQETRQLAIDAATTGQTRILHEVGVVFFTIDSELAESAIRALSPEREIILVTTLSRVIEAIEEKNAGVLVTDFSNDGAVLQRMIAALKGHLPELVTIVINNGRDTTDMINMINFGRVFRYLLKPIDPGSLRQDIDAAAAHHLYLRNNPELARNHEAGQQHASGRKPESLDQFFRRVRNQQNSGLDPTGSSD